MAILHRLRAVSNGCWAFFRIAWAANFGWGAPAISTPAAASWCALALTRTAASHVCPAKRKLTGDTQDRDLDRVWCFQEARIVSSN